MAITIEKPAYIVTVRNAYFADRVDDPDQNKPVTATTGTALTFVSAITGTAFTIDCELAADDVASTTAAAGSSKC